MATDRALLEAAAKAAGYDADGFVPVEREGEGWIMVRPPRPDFPFNTILAPLTDDGDALRLAVKLNLTIKFDVLPDGAIVKAGAPWHGEFLDYWWIEWLLKDSPAATRRAIVRAAATIGGLNEA